MCSLPLFLVAIFNTCKYITVEILCYIHKKYTAFKPLYIFAVVIFTDESNCLQFLKKILTLFKQNLTDGLININEMYKFVLFYSYLLSVAQFVLSSFYVRFP